MSDSGQSPAPGARRRCWNREKEPEGGGSGGGASGDAAEDPDHPGQAPGRAAAAPGRAQGGASPSPAPSRAGPAHRADESAGGGGAGSRGRGLGGGGGGAGASPAPGEGGATPHPACLSTAQPGIGPARRAGPRPGPGAAGGAREDEEQHQTGGRADELVRQRPRVPAGADGRAGGGSAGAAGHRQIHGAVAAGREPARGGPALLRVPAAAPGAAREGRGSDRRHRFVRHAGARPLPGHPAHPQPRPPRSPDQQRPEASAGVRAAPRLRGDAVAADRRLPVHRVPRGAAGAGLVHRPGALQVPADGRDGEAADAVAEPRLERGRGGGALRVLPAPGFRADPRSPRVFLPAAPGADAASAGQAHGALPPQISGLPLHARLLPRPPRARPRPRPRPSPPRGRGESVPAAPPGGRGRGRAAPRRWGRGAVPRPAPVPGPGGARGAPGPAEGEGPGGRALPVIPQPAHREELVPLRRPHLGRGEEILGPGRVWPLTGINWEHWESITGPINCLKNPEMDSFWS